MHEEQLKNTSGKKSNVKAIKVRISGTYKVDGKFDLGSLFDIKKIEELERVRAE